MVKVKTKIRIGKPDDKLVKRQATHAGDVIHEFFELPGKFVYAHPNDYPQH